MRENFNKALEFILESEGGYVNHKADRGGETKYGISKQAYPEEDIPNLTIERAAEIYREDYWNAIHGDDLPSCIDYVIFDSAVNHGPEQAGRFLQRALNRVKAGLEVDGQIGPKTLATAKSLDCQLLFTDVLRERDIFYRKIVATDPSQEVFMRGWMNRISKVAVNARELWREIHGC